MDKYLIVVFVLYLLITTFGYWLEYLNILYLKKYGSLIPPEFEGHIDRDLLNKTKEYVIENTKFGIVSSVFHNIIIILFLFGSLLDVYNSWITSLGLPFLVSGLVFFSDPVLCRGSIDNPF